jgi:hypothetical protein
MKKGIHLRLWWTLFVPVRAAAAQQTSGIHEAPAPLYRDPVYDGAGWTTHNRKRKCIFTVLCCMATTAIFFDRIITKQL